jgi:hypothetical protein
VSGDRHSVAETATLLTDPDEIARREAENGLRQFSLALDIIRTHVKDRERPFRLRSSTVLQLHKSALDGIHPLAGTWRNTPVKIGGSGHTPPEAAFVSEEIESMCAYVNERWATRTRFIFLRMSFGSSTGFIHFRTGMAGQRVPWLTLF